MAHKIDSAPETTNQGHAKDEYVAAFYLSTTRVASPQKSKAWVIDAASQTKAVTKRGESQEGFGEDVADGGGDTSPPLTTQAPTPPAGMAAPTNQQNKPKPLWSHNAEAPLQRLSWCPRGYTPSVAERHLRLRSCRPRASSELPRKRGRKPTRASWLTPAPLTWTGLISHSARRWIRQSPTRRGMTTADRTGRSARRLP